MATLAREFGPWTLLELTEALGFILAGFILRAIVNTIVAKRLIALAEKTETKADDIASKALVSPLGLILPVVGIYLAVRTLLSVHPDWLATSDKVFMVVSILVITWTAFKMVDAATLLLMELASKTDSKLDDHVVPLVRKALKTFISILAFILVAQNLGYSVSGLLAGLGIGGLALAMASKDTLANLFGSIMILIDRPFQVGDWITFPGGDGVVEEVGMRSTRIRTFAQTGMFHSISRVISCGSTTAIFLSPPRALRSFQERPRTDQPPIRRPPPRRSAPPHPY